MAGSGRSNGQGSFWGDLVGPNPTDRAKAGVKRSLLVEADGGPLSVVVAGANVPDFKLLEDTLDAVVVERPEPTETAPQHLCLDKGYDKQPAREVIERHAYTPHIRKNRRREAGCGRRETLSGETMGSGADTGLAQQVPGHTGALREEGR